MENSINHVESMRDYSLHQGKLDAKKPYPDGFEVIYESLKADDARRAVETEKSDLAVEKFREELRTKGALLFLAELNIEKIEEKVEAYRRKLIEQMGDSPEAMIQIDEMVDDYRKQLLEELQNSLDSDEERLPGDVQAMVQALLDMQSQDEGPLEKLLHQM